MVNQLFPWIALLVASALYIWTNDLSWWEAQTELLVLVAVPLIPIVASGPWATRDSLTPVSTQQGWLLSTSAVLWFFGLGSGYVFPLALSWTLLLFVVLNRWTASAHRRDIQRLLPFALLAFPWIALDGELIGWYFRLTGAIANEAFLNLAGLDVTREGVSLVVSGLTINVLADCDGIDTLQTMLMAGGVLGFYLFRDVTRGYWLLWPLIIALAWLANTLRIMLISVAGLTFGADFAMGTFHDWGGTISVALMFLLFAFLALGFSPGEDDELTER